MKKIIIIIFIFLMQCISIDAYTFPNKIESGFVGGMNKYGFPLTKIGSKIDGYNVKGFCTKWQLDAPAPGTECTAVKWTNNKAGKEDANERAAAAIGNIITSLRSSDGSYTWDNYFYATFAINGFLYDEFKSGENIGSKLNYAATPDTVKKIIKPYIDNAKAIYKNYTSDTFNITGLSLNGEKIDLKVTESGERTGETVTVNKKSEDYNYIIRNTMECYETGKYENKNWNYGNKIVCDSPSLESVSIDDKKIRPKDEYNLTVSSDGKKSILSISLAQSVMKDLDDNQPHEIKIKYVNRTKHQYAQNYDCKSDKQTVAPNYIKLDYGPKENLIVKFNVKIEGKDPTCNDSISTNYKKNYEYYATKLLSDTEKKSNSKVIDIDDPACAPVSFEASPSCEKTDIPYEWVNVLENEENKGVGVLCKTNFSFENLAYIKSSSTKGNLLYSSNDGVFGKGLISYECKTSQSIKRNYTFNIKQLIPKVSFEVNFDNKQVSTDLVTGADDVRFLDNSCHREGEEFVCNSTKDENDISVLKFNAEILYRYGVDAKYMVSSSGNLVKWQEGNKAYGYGILVPDNVNEGKENAGATLIFSRRNKDGNATVIGALQADSNEEITASCDYEIIPEGNNEIKQVLYRTIDVNNPFKNYKGGNRLTGGNWCSTDEGEISGESNVLDESPELADGDVNMDGKVDNDDVILIQKYLSDGDVYLSKEQISRGDLNPNKKLDIIDVTLIQEKIGKNISIDSDNSQNSSDGSTNSSRYCRWDNDKVKTYITNRPSASSKGKPLYSFKLTPKNIKEIRNYNKSNNSYSTSNEEKSEFVSKISYENYAEVRESLCNISEKCNITDVIDKEHKKGENQ